MLVPLLLSAALAGPPAWSALDNALQPVRPTPCDPDVERDCRVMAAHLTPIGFSAAGAFAYLELPPDEAVGCLLWELVVVDLVSDKVLERQSWRDRPHEECESVGGLAQLYKTHGARWQAILDKHEIEPTELAIQPVPFERSGDHIGVRLVVGRDQWEDGDLSVPIGVSVRSRSHGEKTVGTVVERPGPAMRFVWDHSVVGMVVSPFEARAAVVVRSVRRGYEGPPHVEDVVVFGASLDKGFK